MDWIIETVYSNTLWLYKVIYSNKIFFIDFWTFNHIWSGAFIFILLSAYKVRKKWLILIIVLFSYEIIEILFRIFALNLFKPEIIKDQINDIIFGLLGAVLSNFLIKFRNGKSYDKFHLRYPLTSFLTAGTFSYLYVGFSDFNFLQSLQYTVQFKITIFILNWITIYYLIQCYEVLNKRKMSDFKTISILSIIFLPILVVVHFIAWLVLTGRPDSINSFISDIFYNNNGNVLVLLFFLLIPTIVIILFRFFKKIINKAI